ncbi:MAG: hypothetical protein KDA17_05550 [Candidatus Saccharibacteria bacterium]|nr:hypothetical protein [Candidatus Saccharibacteria bacterium]
MAGKRNRDYAAEYAKAKALAQRRGFSSERQYKAAMRRHSIQPVSDSAKKRQAQRWSDQHSIQPNSKFEPNRADEYGVDEAEYVDAYWDAFVGERQQNSAGEWDLDDLWYYFTDITGYYDDADIQERYKSD